jgi:hypothetical protein
LRKEEVEKLNPNPFWILPIVLYDWQSVLVLSPTNKKSPCGAEGEEKARYPQGREDAKWYFVFSSP